jgi:hypothetical protein
MRKSVQKSLKNEVKTFPNPLKKHAHFDANFCVQKLTTLNRIWTPKRVQVDPKINRKSKKNRKNQNSKIMEMQKMQKMQKQSKSDAPDLERTPKVRKILPKSDKKSSGH